MTRTITLVEELIGWGNKFVVLNANPAMKHQSYIINAGRGVYKDGVWMSNQNHCPTTYSNTRTIGSYATSDDALDMERNDEIYYITLTRCLCSSSNMTDAEDEDYDKIGLSSDYMNHHY